jgi:iron complex outermembrane receptor protein
VGNSVITFNRSGFSATFSSVYAGRQYLDNTSDKARSLDPYFVTDLRVGYAFHPKFIKEIGLDFSVRNLFNEMYETGGWTYSYLLGNERLNDAGYFTQAGTNFMGRVTLKF